MVFVSKTQILVPAEINEFTVLPGRILLKVANIFYYIQIL